MPKLIMVFNDTEVILQLFERIFTEAGYKVSLHSFSQLELDLVKQVKPDLIISDHTPTDTYEKQGWQFVQLLRMDKETEQLPVVICTMDTARALQSEGHLLAHGMIVLLKPFTSAEIVQAVHSLIGEPEGASTGGLHPVEQQKTKEEKQKKTTDT
jgi:CheY-like chemotaxis protein